MNLSSSLLSNLSRQVSCLSWNCQGLGGLFTVRALGKYLKECHPRLIFLMETRLGDYGIDKLRQKFNLFGVSVPAIGKSGGLALLWDKGTSVDIQSFSKNHIDSSVQMDCNGPTWRLTGFYGEPRSAKRNTSWSLLKSLGGQSNMDWMCFGDFNEITHHSEKFGGATLPEYRLRNFREALHANELKDLGFSGYPYTWDNRRVDEKNTRVRLDRAVANAGWMSLFPEASVHHLSTNNSDHLPILVQLEGSNSMRKFKHQSMLLKSSDCISLIKDNWANNHGELLVISNKIEEIEADLERLHYQTPFSAQNKAKETALRRKLEDLLNKEFLCKQRANTQCRLTETDRNTRFFHARG